MSLKVWSPPTVQSSGTGIVVGDAYASALGVVPITIAGSKTKIDIKEAGLGGNGISTKSWQALTVRSFVQTLPSQKVPLTIRFLTGHGKALTCS